MPSARGLLGRVAANWTPADIVRTNAKRGTEQSVKYGVERYENPNLTLFENKLMEMALNGYPNHMIADEMATSATSIASTFSHLRRLGYDIPKSTLGRPPEARERIKALVEKSLSDQKIAEITGKEVNNIAKQRSNINKTLPEGQRWSSRGHRYALPIAAPIGGGLLARLNMDEPPDY